MKKQNLSDELAKKTVDTLNEVENAVFGVKTGLTAGDSVSRDGTVGPAPMPPYGNPPGEGRN